MKTKAVVLNVSDFEDTCKSHGKYRIFVKSESCASVASNYLITMLPHFKRHYYDGLHIFTDHGIKDEDIEMIKVILENVKLIKLTEEMFSKRKSVGFSGWLKHQNIDWED